MKIDILKFLEDAGVQDKFYPGKRLVVPCRQSGDFKSHSIVLDWREPNKVRIEVKAGLSGKDLEAKILKKYPVSFQSPTFVDIEIVNDNEEDEETASGKGGSGSKSPKKAKKEKGLSTAMSAFGKMAEGKFESAGQITQMVIMGTEIVADAFEDVLNTLKDQISNAKICSTALLAKAGDFVTKYMPPSFMEPKGDEQEAYKYDREKNADIGFRASFQP